MMRTYEADGVISYAKFSDEDDPIYRYLLARFWVNSERYLNYILLNPSTATEQQDDPTVARCKTRAALLGYDGFIVTNLFALRSTNPKNLKKVRDPIGPENNQTLVGVADDADMIICGWGQHGKLHGRSEEALAELKARYPRKLYALKISDDGTPWHPLYLPYDLEPFLL